jgi:hypothetical protein
MTPVCTDNSRHVGTACFSLALHTLTALKGRKLERLPKEISDATHPPIACDSEITFAITLRLRGCLTAKRSKVASASEFDLQYA